LVGKTRLNLSAGAYIEPYSDDLERWFEDSKLLVDLLSIATRAPLLSRTRYVRLPKWITEIDPNFGFGVGYSGGFTSDRWPQGHELSQGDVRAFMKLARGYYTRPGTPNALTHAIRRLAASLSRPGGQFGQEDRILDTAIALEILYGGKTGNKLAQRAAGLLGATTEQQQRIHDQAKGFYDTRSGIMHMKKAAPSLEVLDAQLEAGRDLACMSLMRVLEGDEPPAWADVIQELLPGTRAPHQGSGKPARQVTAHARRRHR